MGAATVCNNKLTFFHSIEEHPQKHHYIDSQQEDKTTRRLQLQSRIQSFCKNKTEVDFVVEWHNIIIIGLYSIPTTTTTAIKHRGKSVNAEQSI